MPRYFFEVVHEGDIREDLTGTEVGSSDDLQAVAVKRAAAALTAAADDAPPEWWLMEVKNERQDVVGRISFVASGFPQPSRSA